MTKPTESAPGAGYLQAMKLTFWAVAVTLAGWVILAYASAWLSQRVPTVPVLAPPSGGSLLFAVGLPAAAILLELIGYMRAGTKAGRVDATEKLTRDLLKAVNLDAPHATGTGRRYRGMTPRVLLITAHVPPVDHEKLAARFVELTGADPELVAVKNTRKGTVVFEDRPHEDEVADVTADHAAQQAAPDEDVTADLSHLLDQGDAVTAPALPAPVVSPGVQDRAKEIISGVLGPRGARGMSIDSLAVHPNGIPSKMRVRYPASLAVSMDELAPKIAFTLNQSMPAINGIWRHELLAANDMVIVSDVIDPLNRIIKAREPDPDVDLKRGITVGVTEDGKPWLLPLFMSHTYIGGISGSGKSSLLWAIFEELRGRIANGSVRLIGLDPKLVELNVLYRAGAFHRFQSDPGKIVAELDTVLADMRDRKHELASRGMIEVEEPSEEFPFVLIIVDEVTTLAKNPEFGKRAMEQLAEIIREGRALGYGLLTATQDLRVDAMPIRDLFLTSICLRVRTPRQVDMVLGQGVRAEGAYADKIPASMIGVAYAANAETGEVQRVRSTFIPKEDRPGIARKIGASRQALSDPPPEHTAPPAGTPTQDALDDEPAEETPTRVEQAAAYDAEDEARAEARRARAARVTRAAGPPAPQPTAQPTWVSIGVVADRAYNDVVYVRLDADDDVVKVVGVEDSPDMEGDWRVTYLYAGDVVSRATDLPSDAMLVEADESDFAA